MSPPFANCPNVSYNVIMKSKLKILFILINCALHSNAQCNYAELNKIDKKLTSVYKRLLVSNYEVRQDSLVPYFYTQMRKYLLNPITYRCDLDSLASKIKIVKSNDGKVKFYGWDEFTGGSWHDLNCIGQYSDSKGKVKIKTLNELMNNDSIGFSSSIIYSIYEVKNKDTVYYITFAWGTHGSGNQHNVIQVFYIKNNNLVICPYCINNSPNEIIEYPRVYKLNLKFDIQKKEISFSEFKIKEIEEDKDPSLQPTDKSIIYKYLNGIFVRQQ